MAQGIIGCPSIPDTAGSDDQEMNSERDFNTHSYLPLTESDRAILHEILDKVSATYTEESALNQWEEQRQTLLDYQTELKDQIEAVGDRVRDLSVNQDEVARLKGQLKSLEKISEQRQSEIARQEHELKKTKRKNQELNAMIVQSGQESEPFDDTYIRASFDTLMADIEHLVNKYFPAGQGSTGWKEYDKIKESADRNYFLRASIASTFCQELLSHNARVFGLDNDSEEHLGVFEKMLQDSH
ncbi:MAG: hypothetical protein L6R42_009547, partial [Xanthoria sp. 1 TBL-2021]